MGKKASAPKVTNYKQLRKIWPEVTSSTLVDKLRVYKPNNRWTLSGQRITGCCVSPSHDDTNPSFHIYLDRGYAKCYGCNLFLTNPVELWALVKASSTSEALTELKQLFGLKFLHSQVHDQLRTWECNQLVKRTVMRACHAELINAITYASDPLYSQSQAAAIWLTQTRLLPLAALPVLKGLGILPPLSRLYEELTKVQEEYAAQALINEEQVTFDLVKAGRAYLDQTMGMTGHVVFQLDITPNAIGKLKLRKPGTKEFFILQDELEDDVGFFGLSWELYRHIIDGQCAKRVYVVEGEFDCLSVMAAQSLAGGPTFIVVSTGGLSNTQPLDDLRESGFEELLLVSDSPEKKGDTLVQAWLPRAKALRARVFVGYPKFPGNANDPDSMILATGLDDVQRALLDLKGNFIHAPDWVYKAAGVELDTLDDDDTRHKIEIASVWGRLLKNSNDLDLYIDACRAGYNIPAIQLKREIVAQEEDETAFILRIADALSQIFFAVGQRATDNDRKLVLWHKERQRIVQVSLADDISAERELGVAVGTIHSFFSEKIGVPTFLEPNEVVRQSGKFLQKHSAECRWYLRQALIVLAQSAPDFEHANMHGQGIFIYKDAVYIINGKNVYEGVYNGPVLGWAPLPGPSKNDLVFDVGFVKTEPAWLDVSSVDELHEAATFDVRSVYNRLRLALDQGWSFKHHRVTVDFLAAHLLATTVCGAFRRQTVVGIHADTSSGKSRLLMGLISGVDFPRIHLISAAVGMPRYTPAFVKLKMANKTRPLCLDEFEDDGSSDKKARTVSEILDMFRSMVGENNKTGQATRSGGTVEMKLNFNLFIASINKARKLQDANRIITVELNKVKGRDDPVHVLLDLFGEDGIARLRKELALCLLPHIPKLQSLYAEIDSEFSRSVSRPAGVDSRYFQGLYQSITMMKFLGLDYHSFVKDFCSANKEAIESAVEHTDSADIFDYICQSPKLKINGASAGDRTYGSLLQFLASDDLRQEINITGCGLYYDATDNIVVVNWIQATQSLLQDHPRYARETNIYNLREIASRSPFVMTPAQLKDSGALTRLRAYGLAAMSDKHLTAYRVEHLVHQTSDKPIVAAPALRPVAKTIKLPALKKGPANAVATSDAEDNADFG